MVWISLNKGFILNETDVSKKIFSCFSCLMVPTKMVQISFWVFLTKWLEIFVLVQEQSPRIPYVYTVYLVDLLACLIKGQQSWIDIYAKIIPRRYNFKAWIGERIRCCLLDEINIFSIGFNYTSQEGLIYLLFNISQANSMEPQIPNKVDPGEWPMSMTTSPTRFSTLPCCHLTPLE